MIENFERFLREHLNNNKYTYTHSEGEIYRHLNTIPFEDALSENNFIIVGESFFDMDEHLMDENDLFFQNTFKFYKNAKNESNIVMNMAEHIQSRKLFLACLENVVLIEKHIRDKENLTLDTKSFFFSNVFYLRPDNPQPIALPYMSMRTPAGIVRFEFSYLKFQNLQDQINIIHEAFRNYYFKQVLDKIVTEMTDDEKKAITMFYQ